MTRTGLPLLLRTGMFNGVANGSSLAVAKAALLSLILKAPVATRFAYSMIGPVAVTPSTAPSRSRLWSSLRGNAKNPPKKNTRYLSGVLLSVHQSGDRRERSGNRLRCGKGTYRNPMCRGRTCIMIRLFGIYTTSDRRDCSTYRQLRR